MLIVTNLLLIAGVCAAADLTVNGSVGGSVELPSGLGGQKVEDFLFLRWTFKEKIMAEILNGQTDIDNHPQFKGRLQLSPDFSLTVRELSLEDSGEYQRTGQKKDGPQIPTHTIQLQVHEPITSVWIQSEYTWHPNNDTCAVHLVCNSSGDLRPSYTWRMRNQTENSSRLHFLLSPGEGNITITCTAVNAVSQKLSNHTVRCIPPGDQTTETHTDWKHRLYLYTALPAGVSLLCVIIVSLVCCSRRKPKVPDTSQEEMTMYAVVNKVERTQSAGIENPVSLYETVGDVNKQEMTVYATVNPVHSPRAPPSPYVKVL